MNRLWNRWIWILGIWAMAVACKAPEAPDFQGIKNMKVEIQGLAVPGSTAMRSSLILTTERLPSKM